MGSVYYNLAAHKLHDPQVTKPGAQGERTALLLGLELPRQLGLFSDTEDRGAPHHFTTTVVDDFRAHLLFSVHSALAAVLGMDNLTVTLTTAATKVVVFKVDHKILLDGDISKRCFLFPVFIIQQLHRIYTLVLFAYFIWEHCIFVTYILIIVIETGKVHQRLVVILQCELIPALKVRHLCS